MESQEVIEFVKRFLRTMEERDLESAQAMMAPGAEITFPGGKKFSSQEEMVLGGRDRYRWIKKTFDRVDVQKTGDTHIVYVMGTLYGANKHGVDFSGVRYIDRFEIRKDLIQRQDVWNDLAESGVLELREKS